jgi:hypothetical protein
MHLEDAQKKNSILMFVLKKGVRLEVTATLNVVKNFIMHVSYIYSYYLVP